MLPWNPKQCRAASLSFCLGGDRETERRESEQQWLPLQSLVNPVQRARIARAANQPVRSPFLSLSLAVALSVRVNISLRLFVAGPSSLLAAPGRRVPPLLWLPQRGGQKERAQVRGAAEHGSTAQRRQRSLEQPEAHRRIVPSSSVSEGRSASDGRSCRWSGCTYWNSVPFHHLRSSPTESRSNVL